jgi:Ca2+-binding RTX toxin-like protein
MRRTPLLLSSMVLTLLLVSGAALAVNKVGTDGRDTLRGTNGADNLSGKGGSDRLISLAGNDNLSGGPGSDRLDGGPGSDTESGGDGGDFLFDTGEGVRNSSDSLSGGAGDDALLTRDVPAGKDAVSCGSGTDIVFADRADVIANDCEQVVFGFPEG